MAGCCGCGAPNARFRLAKGIAPPRSPTAVRLATVAAALEAAAAAEAHAATCTARAANIRVRVQRGRVVGGVLIDAERSLVLVATASARHPEKNGCREHDNRAEGPC